MIQIVPAQASDAGLRPRGSAVPGAGAGARERCGGDAGRRALSRGKPAVCLQRINHFPHTAPVNRSLSM